MIEASPLTPVRSRSTRPRASFPRTLVAVVLAAGSLVASAASSLAAEAGPSFAVEALSPPKGLSYFVYSGGPGDSLSGRIRVANVGSASGDVALYPVDATTGQTSGAVYLDGKAPRSGVGEWTRLNASRITLAPGEGRIVSFTVRVPMNARPGQHVGGLVAENLTLQAGSPKPQPGGGALVVDIRTLSIVAVQVNVPGPFTSRIAITGVRAGGTHGHQTLEIGIGNTGNTIVKPQGVMDVTDSSDHRVQHLVIVMDSVLPWTRIDYPVLVQKHALGAGTYTAAIKLRYGTGQVTTYHGTFVITQEEVDKAFEGAPPALRAPAPAAPHGLTAALAAGLVAAVILGPLMGILAYRRRRPTRTAARTKVPAGARPPSA
jgi:hypothetical protein